MMSNTAEPFIVGPLNYPDEIKTKDAEIARLTERVKELEQFQDAGKERLVNMVLEWRQSYNEANGRIERVIEYIDENTPPDPHEPGAYENCWQCEFITTLKQILKGE